MPDIYLIRHTTPAVAKGVCYGQTDLDVTVSFEDEVAIIRECLPAAFSAVYTSPLRRCSMLAQRLFPALPIQLRDALMEIHCGEWEMKTWDELPKEVVDTWMADFVNIRIPGGESYIDLHTRVNECWNAIVAAAEVATAEMNTAAVATNAGQGLSASAKPGRTEAGSPSLPVAVVAHGGVIRSILAGLTGTPLIDSFKAFSLHYGCVIRLQGPAGGIVHSVLSNVAPAEKEQHKPSSFYSNKR
jgi:alpha-ribazole phosphatase